MSLSTDFRGSTSVDYSNQLSSVVPTLLIGIGGTGKEILMRFRKRMYDERGTVSYPFVRTVVFDTDMQEDSDIPKGEEKAAYAPVQLRRDSGEWYSTEITGHLLHDAKTQYQHVKDRRFIKWLHPEFFKLVPEKAVKDGSGGYRQAGRLAFFIHYQKIREAIESQLQKMHAYMADPDRHDTKLPFDIYQNRIEVVIVTSLAGGTGSGMFMDMAYLVRDILSSNPQFRRMAAFDPQGIATHTTLVAMLPTPYTKKDSAMKNRFLLNGYAALLEMEHFSTARPEENFFQSDEDGCPRVKYREISFRVNWDDAGGIDRIIEGKPWDTCYLVDDINDRNIGAERDLSDVHQMVADYLYMDLGNNPFSVQKRSVRSNHAPLSSNLVVAEVYDPVPSKDRDNDSRMRRENEVLYENKYGCSFSSFGLAEIFIDPERIRRAAGYRLAARFIRERLIRKADAFGDNAYLEWAEKDLYSVDFTGLTENLSFKPDELIRAITTEDGDDWLRMVESKFDQNERDFGGNIPGDVDEFADLLKWIRDSIDGRNSDPRTIQRAMDTRAKQLRGVGTELGVLRGRIELCLKRRFSEIGAIPTLRLIDEYAKRLTKSREEAAIIARQTDVPINQILERLRDALLVPFPCRGRAVKIEHQRAIREARKYVVSWIRSAAAKRLEGMYSDALQFINEGDRHDISLKQRYSNWREFLERTSEGRRDLCAELDKLFNITRDQPKNDRRIPVVLNWTPAQYDDEINATLRKHREIGPDPKSQTDFDWSSLERIILRDLRVDSTTSLVDFWYKTFGADYDAMPQLVEAAAQACRGPLGTNLGMKHFANGNIAAYMIGREDQSELYRRLVVGSAPYLPSIGDQQRARLRPVWRNILGVSGGSNDSGQARRVADAVSSKSTANSDAPDRDRIDQVAPFSEARLVLLREVSGIPIHFYRRLKDLRLNYDSPDMKIFRMTCHLRWRESVEDLPDIELIDNKDYELIASHVNDVLRGILLHFIQCKEDGVFFADVQEQFTTKSYELGSRISRVIKHACRHADVRTYLQRSWALWKSRIATPNPKCMAVLYNAVQQNIQQFPNRIRPEDVNEFFPPIRNCFEKLLLDIERELKALPGGDEYYAALKPVDNLDPNYNEWWAAFRELSDHIRKTCLTPACESLPILQVVDSDVSKVRFPFENKSDVS